MDDLKKKVDKDREKVKKMTQGSSWSSNTKTDVKLIQQFSANTKFTLDEELVAYILSVELQTPIDLVIISSAVPLNVVESDIGTSALSIITPFQPSIRDQNNRNESNSIISSSSSADRDDKFIAVLRMDQERRVSLSLRTNEGESGDLNITVVTDIGGAKAAKSIKYEIKPLSLHSRIYSLEKEEQNRPKNVVIFQGNIQLDVGHDWVRDTNNIIVIIYHNYFITIFTRYNLYFQKFHSELMSLKICINIILEIILPNLLLLLIFVLMN